METKASHLVIGTFVLIVVAGIFGFVIWLAKLQIDREFAEYFVYFDGTVSGLSDGADVLFDGIPVGSVQDIRIDPDNNGRVRVDVEVDANTPIREGSVAVLQFKGITGVSQLLIESGPQQSPMLKPTPNSQFLLLPPSHLSLSRFSKAHPKSSPAFLS